MSQHNNTPDTPVPLTNRLEWIAWLVMLASFLTFCTLVTLGGVGLYQFLFTSTVPMEVTVQASRGTLGITGADLREAVAQGAQELTVGSRIRPSDVDSQGEMVVRDPYSDNRFVVGVNLSGVSSTATLRAANRPRFSWGRSGYQLDLGNVSGRLELWVADELGQEIELELVTPQRASLVITAPGRYRVDVREGEIFVESNGGPVVLFPPGGRPALTVANTSAYNIAQNDLRAVSPPRELVQNSDFLLGSSAPNPNLPSIPGGWACIQTNAEPSAPLGAYNLTQWDGRNALNLVRGGGAQSSGETGCQQGLQTNEVWQDISTANTLSLQTTFSITSQSLASCGYLGSECPLMVRIDYLRRNPATGDLVSGELIYGFYTLPDFSGVYPPTCPSCRQSHIRVQPNTWYSFDSGNILAGFSPQDRPVAISRIRFYASGHEYDVHVSRFALLAE
ncbi:MAG: hypothetical protein MUF38_10615 [Anaerolineae bacterium]|jgi:hypothetical protein|nr:hypothetical protein [Anaerolineae bacterium]